MNQPLIQVTVNESMTLADILRLYLDTRDDLLLIDSETVVSIPHLELLTDYPRRVTTALVAVEKSGDTLVRANRIASASSTSHKVTIGNRKFAGIIRLSQSQRSEIQSVLEKALIRNLTGHPLDLLLVALVRGSIAVEAAELWGAPYARDKNSERRRQVAGEISQINIGRLRLRLANRANDGFFSVFVLRKVSKLLTWVAVKIGATPNQVTIFSFAIGMFSAYSFSRGNFWSIFLGATLLQLSLIVDCVDGELARYTRKFSEFGAWLDAVTDRVKEYMVYLGLAFGAMNIDGRNLWIPAMLMMTIQTFRHLSDYNFSQIIKAQAVERLNEPVDFSAEFDGIVPSEREPKGRLRYWLGKIVQFPIAERWLAISVSAIVGGPGFTFTIMPILAAISALWVYRGRVKRSLEFLNERRDILVIVRQLDLMGIKSTFTKRFQWIEPSVIRGIEFILLIYIFHYTNSIGVTSFVILFTIVFHHYDSLYRAMQNESKPIWLSSLGLYVGGRVLLLALAALVGIDLRLIAAYFALVFLLLSSVQWVNSYRKQAL